MKTTLFVAAIASARSAHALLTKSRGATGRRRRRRSGVLVACVVIVPVHDRRGFAAAGAWRPFHYGVFTHNVFPFEHAYRLLLFVPLYFVVRAIALAHRAQRRATTRDPPPPLPLPRRRRLLPLLVSFWPMTSDEATCRSIPSRRSLSRRCCCRAGERKHAGRIAGATRFVPAIVAVALIVTTIAVAKPWRNDAAAEVQVVETVLSLTSPDEPVMDLKGESVFRPRPWYFALEAITNVQLRLGHIRDDIAETLVRSRTHVVVSDSLPRVARRFVEANYVPWGLVARRRHPPRPHQDQDALPPRRAGDVHRHQQRALRQRHDRRTRCERRRRPGGGRSLRRLARAARRRHRDLVRRSAHPRLIP